MQNPWKKDSKINPQRERGNRQISNGVYKALVFADLTAAEYKVCLFIIDKTWGFNKSFDTISVPQFQKATGLSERMVRKVIARLKERRVIHYEPSERVTRGSPFNRFMFNKHYDTWIVQGSSGFFTDYFTEKKTCG